jgi:hypothetical protein
MLLLNFMLHASSKQVHQTAANTVNCIGWSVPQITRATMYYNNVLHWMVSAQTIRATMYYNNVLYRVVSCHRQQEQPCTTTMYCIEWLVPQTTRATMYCKAPAAFLARKQKATDNMEYFEAALIAFLSMSTHTVDGKDLVLSKLK